MAKQILQKRYRLRQVFFFDIERNCRFSANFAVRIKS